MQTVQPFNSGFVVSDQLVKLFRVGTSASLGVLVTGMLLLLMCSLIAMEHPDVVEQTIKVVDVVMPEERVIEPLPEVIEKKPEDPLPPPAIPEFNLSVDPVEGTQIAIAPPMGNDIGKVGPGVSSGSAMAIFKVAPNYPRRAINRGIEGFVDLMFDITPTGKTENIRVIYAEPEGIFESSSVKTLAKWKYKPAMDDGVAYSQKNQTTRITYELEK